MNFEKYESKPKPEYKDFFKYYVYDEGKLLYEGYDRILKLNQMKRYPKAVEQNVHDTEAYKRACKDWTAENVVLEHTFWEDSFEELDIDPKHPKIETLKNLAYEYGHSYGYSSIYNYLSDLKDLLS